MWGEVVGASHPVERAGCFLSLVLWMGHLGASATRSGTEGRVGKSTSGNAAACNQGMTRMWRDHHPIVSATWV